MGSLEALEHERSRLECELSIINDQISKHPESVGNLWKSSTGLSSEEVDPQDLGITNIVEPDRYWEMNDAFNWYGINVHFKDGLVLHVRFSDCGSFSLFGFDRLGDIGEDAQDTEGMGALEAWEFLSSRIPEIYHRVACMAYRVYNGLEGA